MELTLLLGLVAFIVVMVLLEVVDSRRAQPDLRPEPRSEVPDLPALDHTPPWMADVARVWGPEQLPTFDDIVGMDIVKADLVELALPALDRAHVDAGARSRALLLWGMRGVGKEDLVAAIAGEFGARLVHVSARFLVARDGISEQPRIAMLVRYAQTHVPSVLFIDDLDMLVEAAAQPSRAQSALHDLLNELARRDRRASTLIVASLTTRGVFAPTRHLTDTFDRVVHVETPDAPTRTALLEQLALHHRVGTDDESAIVRVTEGRTRAEFIRLLHAACALALLESGPVWPVVTLRHVRAAARETDDPPALADLALSRDLRVDVHRLATALAERDASVGAVLVGDDGTGKTTLAMALARDVQRRLITMTMDDTNVQLLQRSVERAHACRPSLLLIDLTPLPESRETQAVRSGRTPDPHADALALAIDQALSTPGVSVIAEARRLDTIGLHLRRPGRLGWVVRVPRPDDAARLRLVRDALEAVRLRGMSHGALASQLRGRTHAEITTVLADAVRSAERRLGADREWTREPAVVPEDVWRGMHLLADAA